MEIKQESVLSRAIGPFLGCLAFFVYLFTMSTGAFPGESEILIAQFTGLYPKLTPSYPLWSALTHSVTVLAGNNVVLILNFLSVLFGGISVFLFYRIVFTMVKNSLEVTPGQERQASIAAIAAGVVASLSMAFCKPFWIISTRVHNLSFHVLILLAMILFLLKVVAEGKSRKMLVFAFLYGLCVVEYAPCLLFACLFGPYLLFVLWCREELDVSITLKLLFFFILGLLLYFVRAAVFYKSEGYYLREFEGYFRVVWQIWKEQYFLLSHSLPEYGWLALLFMSVLPFSISIFIAQRSLNNDRDPMLYLMHVVMTVIVFAVMLDVQIVREMMAGSSRLLVLPHILSSYVVGYLVAYWYRLPMEWWYESENTYFIVLRKRLSVVLGLPLLLLCCFVPFKNLDRAKGSSARVVNHYASKIVESMNGRTWLLGDGQIDYQVMTEARRIGLNINVINVSMSHSAPYMNYLGSLFDSQRLNNLANLGILPLLKGWVAEDPDIHRKLAIYRDTDLWRAAGFTIVPNKLVFLATKDSSEIEIARLREEHEQFWEGMSAATKVSSRNGLNLKAIEQHMGLVANNLGVLFEDQGADEDAYWAYKSARKIDKDNLSSILNMAVMIDRGLFESDAEEIHDEVSKLGSIIEQTSAIWSLYKVYGYVRDPRMFSRMGWVWAMSGQPDLAVSDLKNALDLMPGKENTELRSAVADIFLSKGAQAESESVFTQLVAEDPSNYRALLGLARIELKKGNVNEVRRLIELAKSVDADQFLLNLETASLYYALGKLPEARVLLEYVVDAKPKSLRAWTMLAEITMRQRNDNDFIRNVSKLREIAGGELLANVLQGDYAMMLGQLSDARQSYNKVLASGGGGNTTLIAKLLKIDLLEAKFTEARQRVKALLSLDPRHPFGNHALGLLNLKDEKYDMSEDSFRMSLEVEPNAVVMNDLAWVLLRKDENLEEAEQLIRESISINENMYIAWDTLGVILMKKGQLEEAESALNRALELYKGSMEVYLNMAELQVAKGNKSAASEVLDMVFGKMNSLSPESQKRVVELRRIVR